MKKPMSDDLHVLALKVYKPYISHQIAEVAFLAAYIPLGYKLLDL